MLRITECVAISQHKGQTEMGHTENVNIRLSQCLADRIDAAAAAIGLSRAELMRRAIEAECTSTEELAVWREHEYGKPALDVQRPGAKA